jgi:hypothetical protein
MDFKAPRPHEQKEKAFKLYCDGLRAYEISQLLGVPETTISTWSYRSKWKARAALLKDQSEATAIDISEMPFPDIQAKYKTIMAAQALRIAQAVESTPDGLLIGRAEKIASLDKIARKALDLDQPTPSVVVNIGLLSQSQAPQRTLPSAPALPAIAAPVVAVEPPAQEQPAE